MKPVTFEIPNLFKLKNNEFFYADMHFHSQYSHDSKTSTKSIHKYAKLLGVGVAIADHNEVKGSNLLASYKDVLVIPAIEVTSKNDKDILFYFYNQSDLNEFFEKYILPHRKKYTRILTSKVSLSVRELFEAARSYNALISLAHPFTFLAKKSHNYFSKKTVLFKRVDAIEALNAGQKRRANLAALGWAISQDKSVTGGSDGHRLKWLGTVLTVSEAHDTNSFLDSIKKKNNFVIGTEGSFGFKLVSNISTIRTKIFKNKKNL